MVMISIAQSVSSYFGIAYAFCILLGLVTTMLTTVRGATSFLNRKMSYSISLFIAFFCSIAISFLGFNILVEKVYPVLGTVCLLFFGIGIPYKKCKFVQK